MSYPVILCSTHTYDGLKESTIQELVRMVKPEEAAEMMSQFAKSILCQDPPAWVVDSVRQKGKLEGNGGSQDREESCSLDVLPS